jgi:hypothetical protein
VSVVIDRSYDMGYEEITMMDNNDTVMNIFKYCAMFWVSLMLPIMFVVLIITTYDMFRTLITERKDIKKEK